MLPSEYDSVHCTLFFISNCNVLANLFIICKTLKKESHAFRNSGKKYTGRDQSTKISGNFGPKLNGSVRSNRKSFENAGPLFEVDHFSRSDRLEFWLNGSRPIISDCKISLASFLLNFQILLIRSFIRIRSFFFVSWSLLQKLKFLLSVEPCLTPYLTPALPSPCLVPVFEKLTVNFYFLIVFFERTTMRLK